MLIAYPDLTSLFSGLLCLALLILMKRSCFQVIHNILKVTLMILEDKLGFYLVFLWYNKLRSLRPLLDKANSILCMQGDVSVCIV